MWSFERDCNTACLRVITRCLELCRQEPRKTLRSYTVPFKQAHKQQQHQKSSEGVPSASGQSFQRGSFQIDNQPGDIS